MQRTDAKVLHLGCGEDYHADAWNVDANPAVDPDEVYNLNEQDWPWPDASFQEIRAYHVFEHLSDMERALHESARILEPGGVLRVIVPMGSNALADPDHTWGERGLPWTWRTPEYLTGKRHWDTDVGLQVRDRSVSIHSTAPTIAQRAVLMAWWELLLSTVGAGEWCFGLANMGGEFTIEFQKP